MRSLSKNEMNVFRFAAQLNAGALVYVISQYNWIQASGEYIKYNGKKYDHGNNYDLTTYKYTAPLSGQYLVTSNLYTSTNRAHQEIQINGVGFTRSYTIDMFRILDHGWDQSRHSWWK